MFFKNVAYNMLHIIAPIYKKKHKKFSKIANYFFTYPNWHISAVF